MYYELHDCGNSSMKWLNLCIILDADNSMQRNMDKLCRICHYHPWELWSVHRYLNYEIAVKVTNAMVSSRLDNCNSLLYHTKRYILSDYKEFKMPYVTLCADSINLVMSHLSCTHYTDFLFMTIYCSSTTF